MAYLIDPRAQVLFVSASLISNDGKQRKIVIECRPEYAIISLQGKKEQFPISWQHIYEAALEHEAKNQRIEAKADKRHKSPEKRPS